MSRSGQHIAGVPDGEWHQYRRDPQLSGRSPLKGGIIRPAPKWTHWLGGSEIECQVVGGEGGRMDLLVAYGGCVLRTDAVGKVLWKSPACGINAIGAVEDLDGDGRPEIVCCSGYEVIVLDGDMGTILMRHYVGFPLSAGTQASSLLCHAFTEGGMHLIVPLMSAKEVLVFDFRHGQRPGTLAHTLWMDDAFHPTVAAADMNGDGVDELVVSKLCGLYVFDVLSGTMLESFRWTSNGERHRNYGLLQLIDVDGDGAREVVIVAERVARHMAVIDNDGRGKLSLRWDRFVEFIYPSDTTELRHTGNSVQDVDGDGKLELIVSIFNGRRDGRWYLEVLDPLTGAIKYEQPDAYLWGIQDVNADGIPELLISTERGRNPAPFSHIQILSLRSSQPRTLWSLHHAHFAGRGLLPSAWRSNFRPIQFGHDETWVEHAQRGATVFLFTLAEDGSWSLGELTGRNEEFELATLELDSKGRFVMSALADLDGDGTPECVLSENNGTIHVGRARRGITNRWKVGFRLQLEGFSAARPGPIPVVYRGPAGEPLVVVPDNTWMMHQLQEVGGRPVERWARPGRGWLGYDNAYHAAYLADIDNDGACELMMLDLAPGTRGDLLALDSDGGVKQRWAFAGATSPAPPRIGLYQWVVASVSGHIILVASFYASYSMNSEQSFALDAESRVLWHLDQYGEGEWGRGVGPWSACALPKGSQEGQEILFFAKDMYCRLDALSGTWNKEPWHLWRATNSVMNQPDWAFTKDHQADFGSAKDPFTAYGSPIVMDIDGDGEEEVLVAGCFGGWGLLRSNDAIQWWKRSPFTDMMLRLPGIADLYGDGRLCVGCCHANGRFDCVEGATGRELWSLSIGSTTSDIVSADIDGDGREEFIVGTTDGRLMAIGVDASGRGALRWSLELGFALGSPVIADVDGDGMAEILVVTGDGRLVCIGKDE